MEALIFIITIIEYSLWFILGKFIYFVIFYHFLHEIIIYYYKSYIYPIKSYYTDLYYSGKIEYIRWRKKYKKVFYTNYFGKYTEKERRIDYLRSRYLGTSPPCAIPVSPSLAIYKPNKDSLQSIIFRIFSVILFFCLYIFGFILNYLLLVPVFDLTFFDIINNCFFSIGLFISIYLIIFIIWHVNFGLKHYYVFKKNSNLRRLIILFFLIEFIILLSYTEFALLMDVNYDGCYDLLSFIKNFDKDNLLDIDMIDIVYYINRERIYYLCVNDMVDYCFSEI